MNKQDKIFILLIFFVCALLGALIHQNLRQTEQNESIYQKVSAQIPKPADRVDKIKEKLSEAGLKLHPARYFKNISP